jgi:scyllo-inositol 2-dehydrogenase (NADP+)
MRCIIVGCGVQGKKRLAVAASEAAGVVDPIWTGAQWKDVREVPVDL